MAVLWPFLVIFLPTTFTCIFHKTEVQTVILRYWTGLYLIWLKSYATNTKNEENAKNAKNAKNIIQMSAFLQNHNNLKKEIFAFCAITLEPISIQTC